VRAAQVDRAGVVRYFSPDPVDRGRVYSARDVAFHEVVLHPGDLLCLPAGTLHAAKAIDGSLALNLALGRPGGAAVRARATGG
jgi:ribosomal protein L16 Arg81 hydroxylase